MIDPIRSTTALLAAALLAGDGANAPLRAQDGPGTTGAPVLQLVMGSRAAAFSGAYTAMTGDADVLFYNPAGAADLDLGVSLAYQRHVEEISFGSVAGAVRIGRVVLGLASAYFDSGEIEVVVPDPEYGGQRGQETGEMASARESASRLTFSVPLGRVGLGAGMGFLTSDFAGAYRSAFLFDLGAQLTLRRVTLGAAVRNIGGAATGAEAENMPLPTEARIGATVEAARVTGVGVLLGADLRSDVRAGGFEIATGVEAGLLPRAGRRLSAVARLGVDTGDRAQDGLSALRFGAGLSLDRLAIDYTYQELDFFGAVHRFGVRWTRPFR